MRLACVAAAVASIASAMPSVAVGQGSPPTKAAKPSKQPKPPNIAKDSLLLLKIFRSEEPPLLTVRQVAERLGVCTATVYRLCDEGQLPHVRVLHAIWVAPADLAAFIRQQRRGL